MLHLSTKICLKESVWLLPVISGWIVRKKQLSITPDECIAFGDAMNDKTLLKNVKYSYAMKNADKNIKKIALRETDDNNHDGVLKIISLLLDNQFNY